MVDQEAHLYFEKCSDLEEENFQIRKKNNLGEQLAECFKNDPRVTSVML